MITKKKYKYTESEIQKPKKYVETNRRCWLNKYGRIDLNKLCMLYMLHLYLNMGRWIYALIIFTFVVVVAMTQR